ncbi:hypothetical protein ACFQ7A_03445 [Streptomyces sp. NPDC056528]|uniref:hypothetical protein n=1 Tax=Streptomyces sp. NPDC056528 TaxID=3345854 RepID=UPI0036A43FAA
MIHFGQRLAKLLPASTETSIPLVFTAETQSLSLLALKLYYSALTTTALVIVTALHGPVVPDHVWWAVVAGTAVDRSVFSYQRFRRR